MKIFFLYRLECAAGEFYNIVRINSTFEVVEYTFMKKYNIESRQIEVKGNLKPLHLRTLMC